MADRLEETLRTNYARSEAQADADRESYPPKTREFLEWVDLRLRNENGGTTVSSDCS
jgi:hypothetical protein